MNTQTKPQNKHSNSTAAQEARIADYLIENIRATTIELREILDIMHPAGRIKGLRAKDWDIVTHWEYHPTACGKMHRVGVYVLLKIPKDRKV